jgi:hypothetical protein
MGINNPLSISGYQIDPETLEPEHERREQKRKLQEDRYKNLLAEGEEVISELSDDRGLIVKEAVKLFVARVNELIATDPECQVFEKLFLSIKLKMGIGEAMVKSKAWSLLNK